MITSNHKGFTLVELLVVIAIIAVLGVVAIAAINPAARINSAKDQQAAANVQQISKAFEACLTDRMSIGGVNQATAVTNCCGSAAAGACVSNATTGLGNYGLGFTNGFPSTVTVNRSAATAICVSQLRGSDTNYDKYLVGGGTMVTNAGAACANGV